MTLLDYDASRVPAIREVPFDRFWMHSRFSHRSPYAAPTTTITRQTFESIDARGGHHAFLECKVSSTVTGSMAVFIDPAYHSAGQRDLGCFGLVSIASREVLATLIDAAIDWFEALEITTIRGPVNVPRFLWGYGLQVKGFDLPAVAGVSSDPPEYADFFLDVVDPGILEIATTYVSWQGAPERARDHFETHVKLGQEPLVHPNLANPDPIAGQVARLMNANMAKRPDGFAMRREEVMAYASLFRMVQGGERLLSFVMDGNTIVGGVIMQPDWFQVLGGLPISRIVQDTMAIDPAYRGKGLGSRFFLACRDVIRFFQPEYFEYIYSLADDEVVNHLCSMYTDPAKAFLVYQVS